MTVFSLLSCYFPLLFITHSYSTFLVFFFFLPQPLKVVLNLSLTPSSFDYLSQFRLPLYCLLDQRSLGPGLLIIIVRNLMPNSLYIYRERQRDRDRDRDRESETETEREKQKERTRGKERKRLEKTDEFKHH